MPELNSTHDNPRPAQVVGDVMAPGSPNNRSAPQAPDVAHVGSGVAQYFSGQGSDVELAGLRLRALLGVDRFRVDHEKAAARHARHAEAARKAVSGLRSLLGPAVAEPVHEHVRALVADVAKAASVAAGAMAYADRLGAELATTSQALQVARRERADAIGMVAAALGEPHPGTGTDVSLTAGVSTLAGELGRANYKLNALAPIVGRLLRRQTLTDERGNELKYQALTESIHRAAQPGGRLPRSTVRRWLAAAEAVHADHVAARSRSFDVMWQEEWASTPHADAWLLDDVVATETTVQARIDAAADEASAAGGHGPVA